VLPTPEAPRLLFVIGEDERLLHDRGRARLQQLQRERPGARTVVAPPPEHWPFLYPLGETLPEGPVIVWADQAHRAFESHQTANTRLVTTQASYLMTEWEAALTAHGNAWLVATVQRASVARHAEEILWRRGVFARARVEVADGSAGTPADREPETAEARDRAAAPLDILAAAFREADPAARLRRSIEALGHGRTPPALVATASVCQEVNDLEGAARDLDEAIGAGPLVGRATVRAWQGVARLDNMEEAAAAFRAATERLPAFGGAWGNLGATLGELDRPAEALAPSSACSPSIPTARRR
jgi:tetratricopeptide (TPR) repeat protein